jgi:predicted AAA+ superfamily ATPase
MITRSLEREIKDKFFKGKAVILIGPRQVGKTTLINQLILPYKEESLFLNGDDPTVRQLLHSPNIEQIRQIIGNSKLVFIDEAQRISNIGLTSKIITDQLPSVQLILSGSSAFELSQQTQEPLTGRKWSYQLWPISWEEWQNHIGYVKAEQDLENRLVFGFYPDVLNHPNEQKEVLNELADSYLYKDILIYGNLKKPELVLKLVQALAHQIGNEVSYKEVGDLIGLDSKTVSHYIDILEKAYVVFRLPAFSRNLRDEIKSNRKIYFYDNGIRNAVIGQLMAVPNRQDIGALWENFLISERVKQLHYHKIRAQKYFWRTKQQQEVDYVEEVEGKLYGYEFKWNPKRNIHIPKTFSNAYASTDKGITRENFREFVMLKAGSTL